MRALDVGERVRLALHDAQLAGGGAPEAVRSNSSCSGASISSAGLRRQCMSQKPTTARLLRISAPVATVFGSRDAIP